MIASLQRFNYRTAGGARRGSVRVFCSTAPEGAKQAPLSPKPAAPSKPTPPSPPKPNASTAVKSTVVARPVRAAEFADTWGKIVEAEKNGTTLDVVVKSVNKGGVMASFGELKGFVPLNQLVTRGQAADLQFLIGKTLKTKVVSVEESNGRKEFVLSEKKVQQSEAMRYIKLGSTVKAVVSSVADYGAFVELVDVPGVAGLVHKSELSWDSILTPDSVVKQGQVIKVKVIDLDPAKGRLALSLKQTQPDPIKVTMDTVEWGPTRTMPADMEELMRRLKTQPGVEDVTIGRQAVESKIASQELGVYLTKETAVDGFNVVARLGNLLQELRVVSKMSREEAREMLARIAAQA